MRNYINRLHVVLVVALLVLTVGLGLIGWSIRPSSGGFSPVPADLQLFVPTAAQALAFTETISPASGGGAVLALEGTPQITDVIPTQPFTLVVDNLGDGRLCTPSVLTKDQVGLTLHLPLQHIRKSGALDFTSARNHPATISGRGYFFVRLCWPSHGPVAVHGAYLNARFPPTEVFAATNDAQDVARQLTLGASDATTADYSVQSLQQPTTVSDSEWTWAARTSHTALPEALAFTAVNTSETQHDSYEAFISGIFFGVAGGALVSLVAELVAPFRPRQERRPPEPGG